MMDDFCMTTQEGLEGIKESISTQDLPTAVNTIKEFLEKQDLVELNVGVTGESGSGKSKFVNAFRGLGDEEEGSAQTGPIETTLEPEVYLHPKYNNVKVWDLPGIGTPSFKVDEYLKLVEFERLNASSSLQNGSENATLSWPKRSRDGEKSFILFVPRLTQSLMLRRGRRRRTLTRKGHWISYERIVKKVSYSVHMTMFFLFVTFLLDTIITIFYSFSTYLMMPFPVPVVPV